MFEKHQQMSLADIYSSCKEFFQNDKPKFLQLLNQYLDLSELVPVSFHRAYYKHLGRNREYSLYSMLSALMLQKILGLPTIILILSICKEARDFCGFNNVPDHSQFTRFKQEFVDELENFLIILLISLNLYAKNLIKNWLLLLFLILQALRLMLLRITLNT